MRIYLAPMEGVIDHQLRYLLTQAGGIDLCTTEFVRVTEHTLPRKVFFRYCPELLTANAGLSKNASEITPVPGSLCPVRVQLLGSNPHMLAANAVRAAQLGAPGIDLNFGCPAKTVNRHRGGACLLDETDLLAKIVREVRSAVPHNIPVSVKIRLGYQNRDSGLRNAIAIENAGANELVVHARSKADSYRPPAYWKEIATIRKALTIPVVANGDIWNIDDYIRCREESACEDIMLGRGILARPDLALHIRAYQKNEAYQPFAWTRIANMLRIFFVMTLDQYPKKYLGNRVKQWLHYLQLTYPEARLVFEKIKKEKTEEALLSALT